MQRKIFTSLLLAASISLLLVFLFEIQITSKSSFFIGPYSKSKLLQLLLLLIATAVLGYLSLLSKRENHFSLILDSKNPKFHTSIIYISLSVLLICNAISTTINPSNLLLKFGSGLIWCVVVSSLLFVAEFFFLLPQKNILIRILSSIMLLVNIAIIVISIAKPNYIDYSYASDFLKWHQGLLVFWVLVTLEYLRKIDFIKKKYLNFLIPIFCVSLFFVSGTVWNQIEFRGGYNMVGPFKPGAEWFPHSDSVRFDEAAQSIFIGEGISFHKYVDNPLMVFHMFFLHFWAGGSFNNLMNLQVWIFSIIPVLLFILGYKLSGCTVGVSASLLYFFRVCNFLENTKNTGYISPKIFMSEGLLEPLIILLVLILLIYFANNNTSYLHIVLIGGLFSLTTLVRANVWLFLPLILLFILVLADLSIKQKLRNFVLFLISITIFLSPWMYRSYKTINTPFFFLFKFQNSIVNERYNHYEEKPQNNASKNSISLEEDREIDQADVSEDKEYLNLSFISKYEILLSKIVDNFGKNLSSLRVIPNLSSQQSKWTLVVYLSYTISLIIFLIGLFTLYRSNKNFWILLGMYLAYITASSLALTSRTRYSQPVEWILLIIFSIGMTKLSNHLFKNGPLDGTTQIDGQVFSNTLCFRKIKKGFTWASLLLIALVSLSLLIVDIYPFPQKMDISNSQKAFLDLQTNLEGLSKASSEEPKKIVFGKGRIIYALSLVGDKVYDHVFFSQKPYLRPNEHDMLALYVINENEGKWIRINLQQQDWPKETLVWKDVIYYGFDEGKTISASELEISNDKTTDIISSDPKLDLHY